MRLQNKKFVFDPIYEIGNSKLRINDKDSNIDISELFHEKHTIRGNTITGYSILEFLDSNGNIQINEVVYNIKFVRNAIIFSLKNIKDPSIAYKDKQLSPEQEKAIENKIEEFIRLSNSVEEPTQPREPKTDSQTDLAELETNSVYESEDYEKEKEKDYLKDFIEYNTNPKSNYRALVKLSSEEDKVEKVILVEIFEDDYEVLEVDDYEIEIDHEAKTINVQQLSTSN